MTLLPTDAAGWPVDRLVEARAVIADVAHHRDHMIRLACGVLIAHGETPEEREEARRLLIVVEARTPLRLGYHQKGDDDRVDGADGSDDDSASSGAGGAR
jgi:hypothetical protein